MPSRIKAVRVTPIASRDPPLLNVQGVHQPWALRSIIEIETDDERVGLGKSYGDLATLNDLERVRASLAGLDVFDLNSLHRVAHAALGGEPDEIFPPACDERRASAGCAAWRRRAGPAAVQCVPVL